MKQKLKDIVKAFHKYNSEHMARMAFGLDDTVCDEPKFKKLCRCFETAV